MPWRKTSASVRGSEAIVPFTTKGLCGARVGSTMEDVRKAASMVLFLALAGCPGAASRADKVPDELRRPRLVTPKVPDRHLYGPVAQLRPGQWARYREGDRTVTLAAVATELDRVWIEVIEEGEPRQVSARLVG